MISSLRGKLLQKGRNEIVIEAGGVGYQVFISSSASASLPGVGDDCMLLTHLDVKENSLQLYGFSDSREREIFRMLISVSGIGPKLAHSFVANLRFEEIVSAINSGGKGFPVRIPGIGQKKLELISMSLRDKIFKLGIDSGYSDALKGGVTEPDLSRLEALNALINLGYQRSDAEKIIREVLKETGTPSVSTEELIRRSLEYISK